MIEDTLSRSLGLNELPENTLSEIEKSIEWIFENTDSNVSGENNPFFGKKHTVEARKTISEKQLGNKKRLGKTHSTATKNKISATNTARFSNPNEREKISKSLQGRNLTEETKVKMSVARKGVSKSEEHKRKLKESNIKTEKIECKHCGVRVNNRGLYTRWHGDNCRSLNVKRV